MIPCACYSQRPCPLPRPLPWELCGSPARWWFPTPPEHCGPHRGLDSFSGKPRGSGPPAGSALPIEGVILSLQDLIGYFEPPSEELQHEEKQTKLRSLRNRQSLFQEEVKLWREGWGLGGRSQGRSAREGRACRKVKDPASRRGWAGRDGRGLTRGRE